MAAAKKTASRKKTTAQNKAPAKSAQTKEKSTPTKQTSARGQAAVQKEIKEKEDRRLWSVILFFYGILALFLTYIKGDGGLWTRLFNLQRGIFGDSVYLFAPLVIYVAYLIAANKSHSTVVAKIIQGLVCMLLFSGIVQVYFRGQVEGGNFIQKLVGLYTDGKDSAIRSGGLASAVIGWPLLFIFKKIGARIIIVLLTVTFLLLLTNLTLPQIFNAVAKPFKNGYKAVNEERLERASQPPKERPAREPKKSKTQKRVDIAKYIQDDDVPAETDDITDTPDYQQQEEQPYFEENNDDWDDDVVPDFILPAYPTRKPRTVPVTNEFAEDDVPAENPLDNHEDKEMLRKIIEQAVAETTTEVEEAENEAEAEKSVYVESSGQTTLLENEKKIPAYSYPPVEILKFIKCRIPPEVAQEEIQRKSETLVNTLESFGVKTRIIGIHRGPAVTRYELQPAAGVKVKQITNLADDIALNLAANAVRIEAPIPGKAAIGIEIPNENRESVSLRELIDSDDYRNAKGKLNFAVGKDIEGNIVMGNIASMPHMLIAGTTGSGKSVFTNSIIINILYHAAPEEVKLVLIDPKKVEFPIYNGIPHLLIPVVTEPLKAAGALGWAVNEMTMRYKIFEANGVKNLEEYNQFVEKNPELNLEKKPQVVIIVDEFADLMLAAKSEVEESVMRLAQLARAAGMHLLIATQSPRVDVITGLIKANIPSRTALSVSNNQDSRVILDEGGAEKLLGRGDLLFKPVEYPKPLRVQSGYASTEEIRELVNYLKNEHTTDYNEEVIYEVEKNTPQEKGERGQSDGSDVTLNTDDDLIEQAIQLMVETGNASTSFLQRKLKLGFARAGRIMDDLEDMGVIGPKDGAKSRQIFMTKEQWLERQARK